MVDEGGFPDRVLPDQEDEGLGFDVRRCHNLCEREFFIDNLLVRIHFIIVMIEWTGLAPWETAAQRATKGFFVGF